MSEPVALVTGAGGEMGHLLVPALAERGYDVIALDLVPLPGSLASRCLEATEASVLDRIAVRGLMSRHRPDVVFHLAAVLSTKAEKDPDLAHRVNVGGTVDLLKRCRDQARETGSTVRFLYPSSIAVYGLPDAGTKERVGAIREEDWNRPSAIYGCNKLYGELLGNYHTMRALARHEPGVDFRSIRFPGLLSAETVPSGGTSDYGPEMIHAAAQGQPYACFVRPDTRLPFMTMPDAVGAFLDLADARPADLTTRVYNIGSFSPTAEEFRQAIVRHFPDARITFKPVPARQVIADSWPADVDDARARTDWGLRPSHGFDDAIDAYLMPALEKRYTTSD
jgi:nucleoside-diphosphate-sugar epimerase